MIAVITDALTRRLIELAIDDLGPPPCPLSWLALGSLGRRVVVPSSDVDSALAFDDDTDDDGTRAYMANLESGSATSWPCTASPPTRTEQRQGGNCSCGRLGPGAGRSVVRSSRLPRTRV